MRLFFSIAVPKAIREKLTHIQEELRGLDSARKLRFVAPELFHVTVAFLGEVAEDKLPEVRQAGGDVCNAMPVLDLKCVGIDGFPLRGASLGILHAQVEGTFQIQYATKMELGLPLASQTVDIRMPETLDYYGHITLARAKHKVDRSSLESMLGERAIGTWTCDSMQIVESRLGEEPRYRILDSFALSAQNWDAFATKFRVSGPRNLLPQPPPP